MKKLVLLFLIPIWAIAQGGGVSTIINPDGKWFFGGEMGRNTIESYSYGEGKRFIQGGISAEYYTGRHWSLSLKVKYFDTGVSYIKGDHNDFYPIDDYEAIYGIKRFKGAVFSFPINIKWEFRIHQNLRGYIKMGVADNEEVQSRYDYPEGIRTDYVKAYWNFNQGFGLTYFISNKMGAYIDVEGYNLGGYKGTDSYFFYTKKYFPVNTLFNIGFKYHFENESNKGKG
ncbi:hypothetical protein OX284_012065 [Flavobacterium sp. SUN046]|uniref:hypothetical protein n=1 Tax=Flavobacterium sp. SUN046 TaxID=3002440 RepID=UPI002DC058F2|nr:hypothetical protein [Flavobacterium sp. SUN046]MEC4050170.1 hypothetical protein [Flavobacterium sp. SUN046]